MQCEMRRATGHKKGQLPPPCLLIIDHLSCIGFSAPRNRISPNAPRFQSEAAAAKVFGWLAYPDTLRQTDCGGREGTALDTICIPVCPKPAYVRRNCLLCKFTFSFSRLFSTDVEALARFPTSVECIFPIPIRWWRLWVSVGWGGGRESTQCVYFIRLQLPRRRKENLRLDYPHLYRSSGHELNNRLMLSEMIEIVTENDCAWNRICGF